jgi:hypothetical protein
MELFNDDHCSLPENWTRMLSTDLSGTAMVSADARARPIVHRAAFEAQIPTEVLRQDESRRPVHHEGDAGKTALPTASRRDGIANIAGEAASLINC